MIYHSLFSVCRYVLHPNFLYVVMHQQMPVLQ